jgi:hypothetical protein
LLAPGASEDRVAGHELFLEVLDDRLMQLTTQPVVAVDHVFATSILLRRVVTFLRHGTSHARLARLGEAGCAKQRSLDGTLLSSLWFGLVTCDGGGPLPKQMFAVPSNRDPLERRTATGAPMMPNH